MPTSYNVYNDWGEICSGDFDEETTDGNNGNHSKEATSNIVDIISSLLAAATVIFLAIKYLH